MQITNFNKLMEKLVIVIVKIKNIPKFIKKKPKP